jgi:preprotein translocase subunit SecA
VSVLGPQIDGASGAGALTRYHALWESVRSRRTRPHVALGLDKLSTRLSARIRNRRTAIGFLHAEARRIDAMAPEFRNHSEAALDESVREVRESMIRGSRDDAMLRRALALIREVARRQTGEEAFLVQLAGALGLVHGRIVEMKTGEGKTLTGSIAAPIIAWQRRHLHVFTVNDYLAKRDAHSREGIYTRCGVSVGAIVQEMPPAERAAVYARSIVYGTPKQITADWLRDQIRTGPLTSAWEGRRLFTGLAEGGGSEGAGGPLVPGLRAALVDEADAVLIDEGVVPLIIARSRHEDEMAPIYKQADGLASRLDEGPDYKIDHLRRKAELRRRGEHRLQEMFKSLDEPIWRATRRAEELVRTALVARHCYLPGQQYQIVDGRVVIVDEFTGRFLADRSWEHGLHQAVEAKEGVEVTADRETLARMSFQRFFRSYPFLAGMTGTAADATAEIEQVYARPVTIVPTNRPVIREQWPLRVFRTAEAKWNQIARSIEQVHAQGRPILVGTRSIASSEHIAKRLEARGLEHRVLNANFDKEEATLIAQAGRTGAITVATNMAGRGTDILLDDRAREAGGLHVILTEVHGARRVDLQFIGRAGRQGDPGSAQIFTSLEDELIVQHAPKLARALKSTGAGEELRSTPWVRRLVRLAQGRAEARARISRAGVLRQDDWVEKHLPGM